MKYVNYIDNNNNNNLYNDISALTDDKYIYIYKVYDLII